MKGLVKILEQETKKGIVTHDYADPDAMAASNVFLKYDEKKGRENAVLHAGCLRHPKNKRFQKLFNIPLVNYTSKKQKKEQNPYTSPSSFNRFIFTDHHGKKCTWYMNGKIKDEDIAIIIDHHNGSQYPQADWVDYRKVGAASTIVGDNLKEGLAEAFNKEEFQDICTALYLGIMSDTNYLEKSRSTDKDNEIIDFLNPHTDLSKIEAYQNVKYPKSWEAKRKNAHNYLTEIGDFVLTTAGVVGNGTTEVMPEEADKLHQMYKNDKKAVLVFGIENNKLRLCVRSSTAYFNEDHMQEYFPELTKGGFNNSGAGGYQEELKNLMPYHLLRDSNLTKQEWLLNYFTYRLDKA